MALVPLAGEIVPLATTAGALAGKTAELVLQGEALRHGIKFLRRFAKGKGRVGTKLKSDGNMPRRRNKKKRKKKPMQRAKKAVKRPRSSVINPSKNRFSHGPFPDVYRVWLRTMVNHHAVNQPAADQPGTFFIKTNSANDPTGDLGSKQPMWWDQLAIGNLYNQYRVVKTIVKVKFIFPRSATADIMYVGFQPGVASTLNGFTTISGDYDKWRENGGVFAKRIKEHVNTASTSQITYKCYPWKHLGFSDWKDDENSAAHNADPAQLHYVVFWCGSYDPSLTKGCHVDVKVDQLIELYDNRRQQTES